MSNEAILIGEEHQQRVMETARKRGEERLSCSISNVSSEDVGFRGSI